MVGALIAFPGLVTGSLHAEVKTNADDAASIMQQMETAPSSDLPQGIEIPASETSAGESDSQQSDALLKELTGQ
jgi:hypothetical protein